MFIFSIYSQRRKGSGPSFVAIPSGTAKNHALRKPLEEGRECAVGVQIMAKKGKYFDHEKDL